MSDQFDCLDASEFSDDERALFDELSELGGLGEARRRFLGQAASVGLGAVALNMLAHEEMLAAIPPDADAVFAPYADDNAVKVTFKVNGAEKSLSLDSRVTLLDALREKLSLTGSKKGCDHGQCGACTVLVDGRRVLSCLTLAAQCEGREVTTIEGIASGDKLHPLQTAFIKHDGFQCGFCTPGQICSAVAMLDEAKNGDLSHVSTDFRRKPAPVALSDDEIRERLSGNLCRCGAYSNILAAVKEVHTGREQAQTWTIIDKEDVKDATV